MGALSVVRLSVLLTIFKSWECKYTGDKLKSSRKPEVILKMAELLLRVDKSIALSDMLYSITSSPVFIFHSIRLRVFLSTSPDVPIASSRSPVNSKIL